MTPTNLIVCANELMEGEMYSIEDGEVFLLYKEGIFWELTDDESEGYRELLDAEYIH